MRAAEDCTDCVGILRVWRKECLCGCICQQGLNECLHAFGASHHGKRLSQDEHPCPELCAFRQHIFQPHSGPNFLCLIDEKIKWDWLEGSHFSKGGIKDVIEDAGGKASAFASHFTDRQTHDDPSPLLHPAFKI